MPALETIILFSRGEGNDRFLELVVKLVTASNLELDVFQLLCYITVNLFECLGQVAIKGRHPHR